MQLTFGFYAIDISTFGFEKSIFLETALGCPGSAAEPSRGSAEVQRASGHLTAVKSSDKTNVDAVTVSASKA